MDGVVKLYKKNACTTFHIFIIFSHATCKKCDDRTVHVESMVKLVSVMEPSELMCVDAYEYYFTWNTILEK